MSWWDDFLDWLLHRKHPKNTTIVPKTTATRFTGTAPGVKRSNNVIAFRQPGTGAVIYGPQTGKVTRADHRTPATGGIRMSTALPLVSRLITTNTTAMTFTGNMPHQILRVQSPAEGHLAIESDPPSLK